MKAALYTASLLALSLSLSACNNLDAEPAALAPAIKATLPENLKPGNTVSITLETSLTGDLSVVQKSGPAATPTLSAKVLSFTPPVAGEYVYLVLLKNVDGSFTVTEIKLSVGSSAQSGGITLSIGSLLGSTVPLKPTGVPTGAECQWTVLARPPQSVGVPEPGCNSRFKPDLIGDYLLQLSAYGPQSGGATRPELGRVTLNLYVYSDEPTALLSKLSGTPSVNADQLLDSSASNDVQGKALTRRWRLLERPALSTSGLSSVDGVQTSFKGDRSGRYTLGLIVNNGSKDSQEVLLSQVLSNAAPTARPDAPGEVKVGAAVPLSGLASVDPEGATLSYAWALLVRPSGSSAVLSATKGGTSGFTADKAGVYQIELKTSDGENTTANTTTVTATAATPPTP